MNKVFLLSVSNFKAFLLSDNKVLQAFPFLQPLKTKLSALKGCAPCQRGRKGKSLDSDIQEAITRIVSMGEGDKARLKALLGAQTVRAYHRTNVNGRMVRKRAEW